MARSKPEARVYASLKAALHAYQPTLVAEGFRVPQIHRIENRIVSGTPDTFIFLQHGVFIELKAARWPARINSTSIFRPGDFHEEQLPWMRKAALAQINAYVIARDEQMYWYLIPAGYLAEIDCMPESIPAKIWRERWSFGNRSALQIWQTLILRHGIKAT